MGENMFSENDIKLLRSEEKFKKLFELSPVGMALIYYDSHEFIEVNNSLLKSIGYSKEELLTMTFWDITPEKYREQEFDQFKELEEKGRFGPNEKEYITKSGAIIPIRISGFILEDADGSKIVWGITEDISLEKENERVLNQLAFYDPLTNLLNRRMMSTKIEQFQALSNVSGKSFGLLYIDLNKFKYINDYYGHDTGDLILKHVAESLKYVIKRDTDVIARIGGDEFVVVFPDIDSKDMLNHFIEDIYNYIKRPFVCEAGTFEVTVSIGSALYPEDGITERELIKFADLEMYKMKNDLQPPQ